MDGTTRDQCISIELSVDFLLHVSRVLCMRPVCRIANKATETPSMGDMNECNTNLQTGSRLP